MNKKKTLISRIGSGIVAAFIMAILFSLGAIPASATEIEPVSASAVSLSAESSVLSAAPQLLMASPAAVAFPDTFIVAAAAPPAAGGAAVPAPQRQIPRIRTLSTSSLSGSVVSVL